MRYDQHIICFYLLKAADYVCALAFGMPDGVLNAIERDHPHLETLESRLNAAAVDGDGDMVRDIAREWCQGWKAGVQPYRGRGRKV